MKRTTPIAFIGITLLIINSGAALFSVGHAGSAANENPTILEETKRTDDTSIGNEGGKSIDTGDQKLTKATVSTFDIVDNSITSNDIKDGTIRSADIANDAVGGREIAGVSKLLFVTCDGKLVFDVSPPTVKNYENLGQTGNIYTGQEGPAAIIYSGTVQCSDQIPGAGNDDLVLVQGTRRSQEVITGGHIFNGKLTAYVLNLNPYTLKGNPPNQYVTELHAIIFKK